MLPRYLLLVPLVLSLAACPAPPPAVDEPPPVTPPTPDASGAGTPVADDVEGAVVDQGGSPPDAAGAPDPAAEVPPPSLGAGPDVSTFGRLISDGTPTVTLHVVVEGIQRGEINFSVVQAEGKGKPAEAIHVQRFDTSTFDIVAPANFERKLVASAHAVGVDGTPEEKGKVAVVKSPVSIGSEDQTITLSAPVLSPGLE